MDSGPLKKWENQDSLVPDCKGIKIIKRHVWPPRKPRCLAEEEYSLEKWAALDANPVGHILVRPIPWSFRPDFSLSASSPDVDSCVYGD